MGKKRGTGASTSGIEKSDARKRREWFARRKEEAEWRKKSGPVVTRFVDPETLKRP